MLLDWNDQRLKTFIDFGKYKGKVLPGMIELNVLFTVRFI